MVSSPKFRPPTHSPGVAILFALIVGLLANSLSADTYRWKDKDGNIHYGEAVPAEYADQPYDIINKAGLVIKHVEDTSVPLEVIAEKKEQEERAPLISEEVRQIQSDRLLVIRYGSEEEILKARDLEIAQLGYDTKVINQSYKSTTESIRTQIAQAANRQRAGQQISAEQQVEIDKLYARQAQDAEKKLSMKKREERIRTRFQEELDRYRFLTSKPDDSNQAPADQG